MRIFRLVMALGAMLFMVACAQESPLDPDQESSRVLLNEKGADGPADPIGGYVIHGNGNAKTRQTYRNARVLYRAALRFTKDNGGQCVVSPFKQNLDGRMMIDYLPGGDLFRNAFTGYRTEPQGAASAGSPGQIGYEGIHGGGLVVGFKITAMGATQEDYLEIEYIAPGVPSR